MGAEGWNWAGSVTANHVLYNFTGASGRITAQVGNVLAGTLLAPNYPISNGDGSFIGELIGKTSIQLLSASVVNAGSQISNTATVSSTGLSYQTASATITINTPAEDIRGLGPAVVIINPARKIIRLDLVGVQN